VKQLPRRSCGVVGILANTTVAQDEKFFNFLYDTEQNLENH
jgi:hypothetical protein